MEQKSDLTPREKAAQRFRARFLADSAAYEAKLAELSAKIPGFASVTAEIESTAMKAFQCAIDGGDFGELRSATESVRDKRRALLVSCGYPPDAADRKYRCEKCSDSGFVGLEMCPCLRREIALASLEASGLGKLVETQGFDTFSLDFYKGRERDLMEANAKKLALYAYGFSEKTKENLLLMGATGLGKTHLTTSVAKVVIERGFDVLYRPAGEFFGVFNRQRFGDGHEGDGAERGFFECDLLILDDLGTEAVTQYTVSWLYDVINHRLNAEKPTIINTNLTEDGLRSRYDDRIASRLLFNFTPILFVGRDVRDQKTRRPTGG